MIIICNKYKLCYITIMDLKYHNLPFGAQLLLWTSRVFFHGSCRTKPSKYDLVNLAYSKVGIKDGSELLKKYLYLLKIESKFHLQPICVQDLTESEIKLIDCIEVHKKNNFNNNYYITLWRLDNYAELFTKSAKNLALAFKKANLDTDLNFFRETSSKRVISNYIHRTLH